jgi:hypothetical protein
MGVPLSKYRVLQSCLDIHCVVSPSENGNQVGVHSTARATTLKRPQSFQPKTETESIVEKPKPTSAACHLLTPNSRMSLTESVTIDAESSIRSPEHTRTLNCWRSAQPEVIGESSGGISQETNRVEEEEINEEEEEECAICSSTVLVSDDVITVLDNSLVVEIHAVRPDSDNEEPSNGQFILRPHRPDRTLFQSSPNAARLEALDDDGYTHS